MIAAPTFLLEFTQARQPTPADGWIDNLLTNLGTGMKFDDPFERAALMPYDAFKQTWR